MHVQARASIDLQGAVLRYAEVERYGSRYRLLRLGSCDFDFDAEAVLLQDVDTLHLDVIADAVADVFDGSTATHLRVALHPPAGYAFFTPLPVDLAPDERRSRLEVEAMLLADAEAPHTLRLTADAIYDETLSDGRDVAWHHVLAVPATVQERFEHVLSSFSPAHRRLTTSMSGAAGLVGQVETLTPRDAAAPPYTLVLGFYGTHTEYTLCHGASWRFSHYAHTDAPSDAVYYATSLINRLGLAPQHVGRLYFYGEAPDPGVFTLLKTVFHQEADRLDPLSVVDLDPGSLSSTFDAAGYTPVVGVAL